MDVREHIDGMFEKICEEAFEDHAENCDGCEFYIKTTDPFGTGDSPTEWHCECFEAEKCRKVEEAVLIIKSEV